MAWGVLASVMTEGAKEQARAYHVLKYKQLQAHGQTISPAILARYPEILDPNWVEPKA